MPSRRPEGLDAARVTATTCAAPPVRSASAQALRVAPVVMTSSTRTASSGTGDAADTRGGSASRSARRRPTCRRLSARTRQGTIGSPHRCASPAAIASAASNPRLRRRSGAAGTGTIVPTKSPTGARPAIRAAASSASPRREPNFNAATRWRAVPSYGTADHVSSIPGTADHAGARRRRASSHRSQIRRRSSTPPLQTAHRGGATRATRSSSIPPSWLRNDRVGCADCDEGRTRSRTECNPARAVGTCAELTRIYRVKSANPLADDALGACPMVLSAVSRTRVARPPLRPPRSRSPPAPCRAPCRDPSGRVR
jgi:hypothetical protein